MAVTFNFNEHKDGTVAIGQRLNGLFQVFDINAAAPIDGFRMRMIVE